MNTGVYYQDKNEHDRLLELWANQIRKFMHTDKKKYKIYLIYTEFQSGAVAKSYMTNDLLIYGEIFAHFLIY
jgi:hypothetical protein